MKINRINFLPKYTSPNKSFVLSSQKISRDTVSFGTKRQERNYETFLTNIPKTPCACCGQLVIQERFFDKPLTKDYNVPAGNILKLLKRFEPRMRKPEREAFRRMEKMSKKFPDLTLEQLFTKKYYFHLANTEIKQLKVLSKIENLDLNISSDSQAKLDNALKKARDIMFVEDKNVQEKRRRMVREFINLKNICPEKAEFDNVIDIIQDLPSSLSDEDSFFLKYATLDSKDLAMKFIDSAKATIEHVRACSNSGADNNSNYIVMCKKCNNKRNSIPYPKLIAENPKIKHNMQKYMDHVIDYLNTHYEYGFEDYPRKIKQQLLEESDGLIDLDTSRYKREYSPFSLTF